MMNFNTSKKVAALVGALMLFSAPQAVAESESPFSLDIGSDFYTDYIFRGQNLYDGTSIQPSASAGFDLGEAGAISAGVWAHLPGEGDRQSEKFVETDYTLSYDVSFDIVSLSVGHIWYVFPRSEDGIEDTAEFYASIGVDTILSPSFTFYRDYDEIEYEYYELGFSHQFELPFLGEGFAPTYSVVFGFASNSEAVYADNGLAHVTHGISFDFTAGDVTFSPVFNYTHEADDTAVNEFWLGTSVGLNLI